MKDDKFADHADRLKTELARKPEEIAHDHMMDLAELLARKPAEISHDHVKDLAELLARLDRFLGIPTEDDTFGKRGLALKPRRFDHEEINSDGDEASARMERLLNDDGSCRHDRGRTRGRSYGRDDFGL